MKKNLLNILWFYVVSINCTPPGSEIFLPSLNEIMDIMKKLQIHHPIIINKNSTIREKMKMFKLFSSHGHKISFNLEFQHRSLTFF